MGDSKNMSLLEYIELLKKRPPLPKYDTSEGAFWERYSNSGFTSEEFCYIIGLVKVP